MNRSFTFSANSKLRPAFTLVELLIVITVIGILVGLLLPAINGAMTSARELSIRTEMVQLEQAIESFKTEYGFYPPSFEQFNRSAATGATPLSHPGLSAFLRYLNRIAPNHQERSNFASGVPRIVVWWNKVGRHLDQQSSLVFWLSGLCKSKQFPITGGCVTLIEPFSGPTRFVGTVTPRVEIERDARFDFQNSQLVYGVGPDLTASVDDMATEVVRVDGAVDFRELDLITGTGNDFATVAAYRQPNGPSNGDLVYRYRDAASYGAVPYAYMGSIPGVLNDDANGDGNPDRSVGAVPVQQDFVNPKTFQLISFGMDGAPGVPFAGVAAPSVAQSQLQAAVFPLAPEVLSAVQGSDSSWRPSEANFAADNMANFASGRLELFWIENE